MIVTQNEVTFNETFKFIETHLKSAISAYIANSGNAAVFLADISSALTTLKDLRKSINKELDKKNKEHKLSVLFSKMRKHGIYRQREINTLCIANKPFDKKALIKS